MAPSPSMHRLSILLPALAFLALTLWSWARWPDPLIDYGQQLYVAWRVAAGEVLYRDLAYFHGPLSAWIHGGLGAVFGVRLTTQALFNLAVVAGVTILWMRLLGRWTGAVATTTGSLVFLTVFAFSQVLPVGNSNWITPYTSEITHGVALGLLAVWSLVRWLESRGRNDRNRTWLVLTGLALGLVFLTKVEVSLALAPALASGVTVALLRDGRTPGFGRAPIVGSLGAFFGAALVPPLLASLTLAPALGWVGAIQALVRPYQAAMEPALARLPLYSSLSGFDRPLQNLGLMLLALSLIVVTLGLLTALAGLAGRRPGWRIPAAGGLVAISAGLFWLGDAVPWFQLARPLPLILAGLALWQLWRWQASDFDPGQLTLTVFALLLLAKMALSARTYHYGFALAMPGVVWLVALGVDRLPRWLAQRGGRRRWLQVSLLALVTLFAGAHLSATADRFAAKKVWIDAGWDGFWADGRGHGINATLAALEHLTEPDDTVLVVPGGVMINYLARRLTPTPYLNWVPTEVLSFGEERMLEDLRSSPPEWVVVVERSTAELGYRYFGQDYAREIGAWIQEGYEPVGGVGAEPLTGQGFGVRWLARREPLPVPEDPPATRLP